MNKKGQFSIIAALLVAIILITTVIFTYSEIRSSPVQNQPPVLSAIDEINLAVKQVLGFAVGYYGSVLQVTGNVSYANQTATSYLQSGLQNIANMNPQWGTSINLNSSALQAYWFSSTSYSSGNLTVNYNLPGLGILGVSYQTSCQLGVQTINTTSGQACLNITQDQNQPLVTLGTQNFNFYDYNSTSSTWQLVNPSTEPTAYANGTYYINLPSGINPSSYVVQVEDQRGIIVVASSFNSFTAAFTWDSTSVQASTPSAQYYVNNYNSSVDSVPDVGTHSNFTAQQKVDNVYDNLTESGSNVTNTYYPTGFILLGSTQNISGSLANLQTNNNVYMTFRSNLNATSLFAHQETITIGGNTYYLLKNISADNTGTTLTASAGTTGTNLMGEFVYPLTGISSIPASTWTINYRAYNGGNNIVAHCQVNLEILMANGAIRSTVATGVAPSGPLGTSYSTVSGTYSWTNYTVVQQTDFLEIDFYINVTTSQNNKSVYLRIDDNTLPSTSQTSVNNILLPPYITQVQFYGSSDLSSWSNLTWTVDSGFSINGVNATFQLYNYQNGTYPTSGNGFNTTIIGTANSTVTQTIANNPTYFRNSTGYWNLEVTATASTQFNWNVNLVRFQTQSVNYALALEEQWNNVNYTSAQLCIKTGSLAAMALAVDAWNGSTWINVFASLNANSWNNVTVSSYLKPTTFTIRFRSTDTVQDSWQIDAALLSVFPMEDLYSLSQQGTIAVELLQNGTMRWLGQNLVLANSSSTLPFPPVPVRSIHVNETINGVNGEQPFQIEDWSSGYHVPQGLTSNMSIFSSTTMLVFLATPNTSGVTIWWNGSDTATQTPYAYTNRYFNDSPGSGMISNGVMKLQFQGNFEPVNATVGTSSSLANFLRINSNVSGYGSLPSYVITNGVVRDIVHQEAEWSNQTNTSPGGVINCSDIYADIVLTLPANATYYTYQVSLMFVQSQQNRTISDLCPVWLTSLTGQVQTENGTINGLPNISNASALFYNYSAAVWAHHWSQSISGSSGAGIMFTDNANQNLYVFDNIKGVQTGALGANSPTNQTIQLLPVAITPVSFNQTLDPRMQDIIWYGAIATFNATTTPIYNSTNQTGLWMLVEYPPTIAVTEVSIQLS